MIWMAVAVLALMAALKLGTEFHRLVWEPGSLGAIDLRLRYWDVRGWFGGQPLYEAVHTAVYPPASYVILWPLVGWLSLPAARWLCAVVVLGALAVLARIVVRESGARTPGERLLAALMLLSMNGTGVCVGNGQLSLLVLALVTGGVLLLHRGRRGLATDVTVALLVVVALVKPNLAAPFFWLVLLLPGRLRPALVVVAGYVALTLAGTLPQEGGLVELLESWALQSRADCPPYGSADLHILLYALGLPGWIFPASAGVLCGLGVWIWFHRAADILVLLGVTALVARFWTYHGVYDDVLVVLPMVVLFRAARTSPHARVLLAVAVVSMLLPARLHYFWPPPWPLVFALEHAAVWLWMLVFLLRQARLEARGEMVPDARRG